MILVTIDLSNVASGTKPGDKVFFWAPHLREGTTTAREEVALVEGLGEVELKPGPVMVHIRAHGVADTGPRLVTVPDEGPVDLNDLLQQTFTYTPPVVSQVAQDAADAREAADRVGTAEQVGEWAQQAESAADRVGSAEQVGVWRDESEAAAGAAAAAASTATGAASTATGAASTAEGAATTAQGIAENLPATIQSELDTRVPTELDDRLPGELDTRVPPLVPPLVASAIAADRAVADAAAAAVEPLAQGAVDEAADAIKWIRRNLTSGEDLNTITQPGSYGIPSWSIANSLINKPENTGDLTPIQSANLTVTATGGGGVHQRWQKISAVGQAQVAMERSMHLNGQWHPWREPWGISELRARVSDTPAKFEMLRQASRLRRGGVVGTAGRTPVALSFDHGFANFRDLVLPELIRLGLPCTVAINPDTFTTPQEGDVTWGDLEQWAINHGIELAHHARSHGDVPDALTNLAALEHQILSTIEEAEDQAPEAVADAMIVPGVSGTKWQGFDAITDYKLWWEHPAGRMILSNFPVVTWGMLGQAVPMVGQPIQGMDRIGLDAVWQMNSAKQKIQQCHGTGLGMSVFMHPVYLTTEGRPSIADLRDFLEWLATERDADRVDVLTVSGFAWADPAQHRRLDIAPEEKWTGDTCTVQVDPLLNWAVGAQMVLEVTASSSGPLTLSATADTGGLSAAVTQTVTVGQKARLAFSIPRSATTLTLTAPVGATRSCRVV